MKHSMQPPRGRSLLVAALVGAGISGAALAGDTVYTMSNATSGNEVLAFTAGASGLAPLESVATGGLGTGQGLGSQGSVVLTRNARWLLVANAGSNDVSVFRVSRTGYLTLASRTPSGGTSPISVSVSGNLVYVLNAGGDGNITGFWLNGSGGLSPVANSTQSLGGAVVPAQVGFDRTGTQLVVTEKATNQIAVFAVGADGAAGVPMTYASAGMTPFGFAFDRNNHLIVSEAAGGMPNASTMSSYSLWDGLQVDSAAVPLLQTAACWVVTTGPGDLAYATNTGSSDISELHVGATGTMSLVAGDAAPTGSGSKPIDAAVSDASRSLYVLTGNVGSIEAYAIGAAGALSEWPGTSALPTSAVGLAVKGSLANSR